jgi:hypothetical protein
MASTNQSPFYKKAEVSFLNASTDEDKLYFLDEMIRECPKHKSSESMLANLRTRRIKLMEKIERIKKSKKGGGGKDNIKKADMQAVIVGFTNSGKSSILSALTNAHPTISETQFTTNIPEIGAIDYEGVKIQLIDEPAFKNEKFDVGIANNTDLLIIVITSIKEIKEAEEFLKRSKANQLIAFNKIDLLTENEKRKISSTLRSKKYNYIMVSAFNNNGISELKDKIFSNFDIIRIYLKEPRKEASKLPMIVKPGATIKTVVDKISKEMLPTIKEIHIWGPSSKFPNQKVGINHAVKDKDIVEFKTR